MMAPVVVQAARDLRTAATAIQLVRELLTDLEASLPPRIVMPALAEARSALPDLEPIARRLEAACAPTTPEAVERQFGALNAAIRAALR